MLQVHTLIHPQLVEFTLHWGPHHSEGSTVLQDEWNPQRVPDGERSLFLHGVVEGGGSTFRERLSKKKNIYIYIVF